MTFEKVQKILAEQLELDADEITLDSSLVEEDRKSTRLNSSHII